MPAHPTAPKRHHEITQHGNTRLDEYYWLRQREDPEVLKFLQTHMDYLEEVMGHTKPLQETLFFEMKERIQETDSTVPEKRGEYLYYERTEAGKQYPIYCRKKGSLDNPEEILLDQNVLAQGKDFCSISGFTISPDGNKLAYSVDVEGNEVYTIYIKDLTNNIHYPETLSNTYGSVYVRSGVEWANDSETIFYATLDDAKRPCKLYYHNIGTNPVQDVLIHEETDDVFSLYFSKTRDNAYIMTHHFSTLTTEERFLSADQAGIDLKIVLERKYGIEYSTEHHKGFFFISTNDYNAMNFKIVKAPVDNPGRDHWQEILPHRSDVLIEDMDSFENYLVVYERRGGLEQIRISDPDGMSNVRYVNFPESTYHFDTVGNNQFDTNILRFIYSSLITPHTTVDCRMDSGEWEILKEENVIDYDKSQYACDFIFATAPDGKQIPISISYKKNIQLDGNNPTLLHGYGAYGATLDAEFTPNRISLLDRGFVYAIGHIRGGSDLGREWYNDGRVFNKKNSFTDFIACAEHLIKKRYTSKEKLAIYGVSAGGLLVNACMIMRPDLFKAVIGKVPFVDVVTSMSDPTVPLTSMEYDEWGNPEANVHQFEYMISYSPYDNIQPGAYPNLLLTGGLNDPRVAYWEPAKFAARLSELKTDDNLLLLKTNFHAGHAGSSGRYDHLKEVAFEYVFLMDRLGIVR